MYEIVVRMQQRRFDFTSANLPQGWTLHFNASVPSTQDLAREGASHGIGSRHVFLTNYQSAGRGRSGRSWTAPPGSALLLTVLLNEPSVALFEHTICVSVSLCEALEAIASVRPVIKWPNDLLLDNRKVCGVLAESSDAAPGYVAVGLGLNVAWEGVRPAHVPEWATAIDEHATSQVDRIALLEEVIRRLDSWLDALVTDSGHVQLRDAWERRLWRRGAEVVVQLHNETLVGLLSGTDQHGALLVKLADGSERAVLDGELLMPGRPPRAAL